MIYVMECEACQKTQEICCHLEDHSKIVKPGIECECGHKMYQIITPLCSVFAREGFPKGDPRWEHATDEPIEIKDKYHLRDICQENGSISRYLEDAV